MKIKSEIIEINPLEGTSRMYRVGPAPVNATQPPLEEDTTSPTVSVECPICLDTFLSAAALITHRRETHPDSQGRPQCGQCGVVAESSKDLVRHFMEHKGNTQSKASQSVVYVCFLCDTIVPGGKVDYKLHLVTRHPPAHQNPEDESQRMGCRECPYSTADYKKFVKHYASRHSDSLKFYKCEKCDFTTHFSHRLGMHYRNGHGEEAMKQRFRCDVCDKCFSSKMGLCGHMASHKAGSVIGRCKLTVGQNKKTCPFSGAFEEMRKHVEEEHGAKGAFVCDYCEYKSNWKKLFDSHMHKTHFKTVRMDCDYLYCSYSAAGISDFRAHIAETHGNRQRGYRCHLCTWTSSKKTSAELRRHIADNHEPKDENVEQAPGPRVPLKDDTKYPTLICGYCGKEVLRKNYNEHIKVHRNPNTRRFFCHLCRDKGTDVDFVKGISMRKHLREVHGIDYIMMNETLSQCAIPAKDNFDASAFVEAVLDNDNDGHQVVDEDASSFQNAMLRDDDGDSSQDSSSSSSSSSPSRDSSRQRSASSSDSSSDSDSSSNSSSSSSSSEQSSASSTTKLQQHIVNAVERDRKVDTTSLLKGQAVSTRGLFFKQHVGGKAKSNFPAMTEVGRDQGTNDSIYYDVIRRMDGVTAHSRHCESARRGKAMWPEPSTVAAAAPADETFHTVTECPVTRAVDEAITSMKFASDQMVHISLQPASPRADRPCPYSAALDHVNSKVEKSLSSLRIKKM